LTSLPSYIDPELWAAFVESRKAMKVPFTPLSQKLVVKRLMKMHSEGWDANASLEKSAIYGYRGVFEVARIDAKKPALDPALEKLERDRKLAVPIPENIRKQLDRLRVSTSTQTESGS